MRMESVMSGECKMVSVRGREGKERTRVKKGEEVFKSK